MAASTGNDPADAYLVVIEMMVADPGMIGRVWEAHYPGNGGICEGCRTYHKPSASYEDCQFRAWAAEALTQLPPAQQARYAEDRRMQIRRSWQANQ